MDTQPTQQAEVDKQPQRVVDLKERTWLPRHCRGDQQAFDQLLAAYRKLVYTFLHRYGIEPQNRDDLFQDIFLKVHLAASSYRPAQPLQPWLISIVLNTVRNFRRDRGRRKHFMTHLKAVSDNAPTGNDNPESQQAQNLEPDLEEQVGQQSTVLWLEQRITALPEAKTGDRCVSTGEPYLPIRSERTLPHSRCDRRRRSATSRRLSCEVVTAVSSTSAPRQVSGLQTAWLDR